MKTRILVVEDEAIVAEDIAGHLERMGYQVEDIVASGEAAVRVATETAPDLVLMDVMLQGAIDGIDAAQQISERVQIPVIYLTANADDVTLRRVGRTSPFGYILKPFKSKELQVAIEIALSRHQAEVEMRKELSAAQQLQQQIEEKSTLKSRYLSMASHDLRTPISIIRMSTHLLQSHEQLIPEEKRQKCLQRIERATDSLTELLEDVLALAQADSSTLEVVYAPVEIVSFCQEFIESIQFGEKKDCQIELISEFQTLDVWLDEKLFWHLLSNLLTNAIKYSYSQGKILLKLAIQDRMLELQVQDYGIGISSEDQSQLFQPFYRASNVGDIPGTGIGLAIVQRSVDLHRGTIQIESELGHGTTFIIRIPLDLADSMG
ncbi:MAG: ATP-binding protein [Microcoleaceae cyanobacterium]